MQGETQEIGVVISGAGARGAYEAGVLAGLLPEVAARTQAAGRFPRFTFLGTSAGALNSALIASRAPRLEPGDSPEVVRQRWAAALHEVTDIWSGITEPRVMDYVSPRRFAGTASRAYHVLTRLDWPHVPLAGVIDIDPLVDLANDPDVVVWDELAQRVAEGVIGGVGAATTARDGRTVVFWHRHDAGTAVPRDERRDIDYVDTVIGPDHVLASSAIPSAFPAALVQQPPSWRGWYYDGGVRLNTPLKPAIRLGLRHLLVVGTHAIDRLRDERPPQVEAVPEVDEALIPVVNQIMTDQLIQDLHTLRRRNSLPGTPPERTIHYLYGGPAGDDTLARLAADPSGFTAVRWLRGALFGVARPELSSYLLFDPGYLAAAVAQGRHDAEATLTGGTEVPWQTT